MANTIKALNAKLAALLKMNPTFVTIQLAFATVALVPAIVSSPLLFAMGFGPAGPIAGYLAPAFQSAHGTPVLFSALQSAAMGGWGVGFVNGPVQGGAVASGVVAGVRRLIRRN